MKSISINNRENWISKCIEFAYLFLPHETPMAGQVFSVYSKLYNPFNQIIVILIKFDGSLKYLFDSQKMKS